jgi:hypothetical protein
MYNCPHPRILIKSVPTYTTPYTPYIYVHIPSPAHSGPSPFHPVPSALRYPSSPPVKLSNIKPALVIPNYKYLYVHVSTSIYHSQYIVRTENTHIVPAIYIRKEVNIKYVLIHADTRSCPNPCIHVPTPRSGTLHLEAPDES